MSKRKLRTPLAGATRCKTAPDAAKSRLEAMLGEVKGTYAAGKIRRQHYLKLMEAVDPVIAARYRSLNDEYDACMDLILATRH